MSNKVKWILMISAAVLILVAVIVMLVLLLSGSKGGPSTPVYSERTLEAGEQLDPAIFLRDKSLSAKLSEDSVYNLRKVGEYPLTLELSDGSTAKVTLRIRDTKAPEVKSCPPMLVKKGSAVLPEVILPDEFIIDATKVTRSFLSGRIDTSAPGLQSLSLRLEDEGGNVTKAEVNIFVIEELNTGYYYEIGQPLPEISQLLPGVSAAFEDAEKLSVTKPCLVTAYLILNENRYVLRYEAKDTQPPVAFPSQELPIFHVGDLLPEDPCDLLAGIEDATELTVRYGEEYILDKAEHKEIQIILTDLGMNSTTVTVSISVFDRGEGEDVTPPTIYGAKDLETVVGVEPDYLKGISVYDGRDGEIPVDRVQVDSSKVMLNTVSTGEGYPVTYSVSDSAGNTAQITAYLKVIRPVVTEEEMEELFDEVMGKLNTAGMSRFTTLSTVYKFICNNCALTETDANTDGGDYRTEAYWGFKLKSGNHETYYAMTAVLLDRLSVAHMRVTRNSVGSLPHTWLLVDYGIGWLYMDCSPMKDFIWTVDGRVIPADSPEAEQISSAEIRRREAMTDSDIASFTALSNQYVAGLNYYKADVSQGVFPATAVKNSDGSYTSAEYTVSYKVDEKFAGGTVKGAVTQTVAHGQNSSAVTATANIGYKFVRWSDGVTTPTRTDRVIGSFTVYAEFALDGATVSYYTVNYLAGEHGTITGVASQTLLYGRNTSLVTALPEEGYYFVCWSDGSTAASRSDAVKGDASYTATFAKKICYTYLAGEGGRIEGNAVQTVIPGTKGGDVVAVPLAGYRFVAWDDGITSTVRSTTDNKDVTLTALFEKDTDKTVTVKYVAQTGGSIEGEVVQTVNCWDVSQQVTAIPEEGYRFVGWSDGIKTESRFDTVIEDVTYVAQFKKVVTITYAATEGGKIVGETVQTLLAGEQGSAVLAVATEGYRFVGWSDGEMDGSDAPERTDTADADLFVTAIFEKIEPEPDPDPEPTPDPEPDPTPDPEPESTPDPESESTLKPDPTPEPALEQEVAL